MCCQPIDWQRPVMSEVLQQGDLPLSCRVCAHGFPLEAFALLLTILFGETVIEVCLHGTGACIGGSMVFPSFMILARKTMICSGRGDVVR